MTQAAIQTSESPMELTRPLTPECREILTPEALRFVAQLVERFTPALRELLAAPEARI